MRTPRRNVINVALPITGALAAVAIGLHAQGVTITGPTAAPTIASSDSSDAWSEAESAALFGTYCATCHEGPGANPQAPGLEVMRRMSDDRRY